MSAIFAAPAPLYPKESGDLLKVMTPQELKNWRRSLGLTRGQFGQIIKRSYKTIWKYETSKLPVPKHLDVIYRVFEILPESVRLSVIKELIDE